MLKVCISHRTNFAMHVYIIVMDHMYEVINAADVLKNCGAEAEDNKTVALKMICGGDLVDSFAVPNLWADNDVFKLYFILFYSIVLDLIL